MFVRIALIGLFVSAAALPMHALTQDEIKQCNSLAASFSKTKAEIVEAKAGLDTKAQAVEVAGELWEEAEIHRLASPAHAQKAADAKAHWETLKSEVLEEQLLLQSKVDALNSGVASFNTRCATKK